MAQRPYQRIAGSERNHPEFFERQNLVMRMKACNNNRPNPQPTKNLPITFNQIFMPNSRRSFLGKAALAAAVAPFASLSNTYGQGLENAVEKTSKYSAPSDLKITDVKCAYSGGG